MLKLLRRVLPFALGVSMLVPGLVAAQADPGTVPAVKPRLGVYQGAGCDARKLLPGFEAWLGRPVDFVVDFLSWDSWEAMAWAAGWVGKCWKEAGKPVVVSMPMLPRDKSFTLEAGARGDYDAKIAAVAQRLVSNGNGAAIIRLGWEFNAPWYTWSATKRPDLYIAHWRRVVSVMRSVPGAQFRFDWTPIIGPGVASPVAAYPGDDVVDIIGADAYNNNYFPPGTTPEQRWKEMRDGPVGLRWHRDFAKSHGKPTSFPEWGTGSRPDGKGGGDDPVFMKGMTQWIAENPPEYHSYWDFYARDYRSKISDGNQPLSGRIYLDAFGVGR